MGIAQKKSQASKLEALQQENQRLKERIASLESQRDAVVENLGTYIAELLPYVIAYNDLEGDYECRMCHAVVGYPDKRGRHDRDCRYLYLLDAYGNDRDILTDAYGEEREEAQPYVGLSLECGERFQNHQACTGFRDGNTRRCGCSCHTTPKEATAGIADLQLGERKPLSLIQTYALLGMTFE